MQRRFVTESSTTGFDRGILMSGSNIASSPVKDPAEWTSGDEPMTGAQASYLHTLARQAGERVKDGMTKAEASQKIDELRKKTGVKAKRRRNEQI
jgi:hypothetical protein